MLINKMQKEIKRLIPTKYKAQLLINKVQKLWVCWVGSSLLAEAQMMGLFAIGLVEGHKKNSSLPDDGYGGYWVGFLALWEKVFKFTILFHFIGRLGC